MPKGARGHRRISERIQSKGRALWSLNAVPGKRVRGESLRKFSGKEWRNWSPRHSKLGAGLLRCKGDATELLPSAGSNTLYLGAGHGTTVSHLYDHLCGQNGTEGGSIVAVDVSPRCVRELIRLAAKRPGLIPVMADARDTFSLSPWLTSKVSWIFQDVSQAGQVDFFLKALQAYLAPGGTALLSLKSESERGGGDAESHYRHAEERIEAAGLEVKETIRLTGWEEKHALIHAVAPTDWGV